MSAENIQQFLPDAFMRLFGSTGASRHSVWVYDGGEIISVYGEERPNTIEIWFEFRPFTLAYWLKFESACVVEHHGEKYYDFNTVRRFMIDYMVTGTNFPGIGEIGRDVDGRACRESLERLSRVHPRIWSVLFDSIDIFTGRLPESEEMSLERQCKTLFGDGQSVRNPHEWVVVYSTLLSFWDKFGLNYYDVMGLPYELFGMLKKMSGLENSYREMALAKTKATAPAPARRFPGRR